LVIPFPIWQSVGVEFKMIDRKSVLIKIESVKKIGFPIGLWIFIHPVLFVNKLALAPSLFDLQVLLSNCFGKLTETFSFRKLVITVV